MWDFERRARIEGDAARLKLSSFHYAANRISHDLPDEKIALYEAGRDFARQLGERWWELFYEHWVIEVLLYGKHQPKIALDHAARAVFETSKPEFAAFPQRLSLQMNLASAYMGIDPIGYESELRAVFRHIEAGCDQFIGQRTYYWQLWGYFLEKIEDAGAVDAAFDYLQSAEASGHDHYLWDALNMLCKTLYRLDRENARLHIGEMAALGQTIARREERNRGVCAFLMWRALAARWDGEAASAERFYRQALELQTRLAPPRNSALFGAVAFHEAGGEWERALQLCQADLRILRGHGLSFALAQRRLEKCALLQRMGRDFSRDAKRLRRLAATMRSKSHWEKRLAELESAAANEGADE